jgi:hypothetical protein
MHIKLTLKLYDSRSALLELLPGICQMAKSRTIKVCVQNYQLCIWKMISYLLFYYSIELKIGFYPVAVVLQKDNIQKYTYHTKQNTAQKATRTVKDTLHTMSTTQKK